jgi:hypothetical protein
MSHLVPCPACDRHVRLTERACPFCATALDARRTVPTLPLPGVGVGRLALFTFALSASLAGCGEPARPLAPNAPIDATDAGADAAPSDASATTATDAGRTHGDDDPIGSFHPLYGVPPAPP